MLAKVALLLAVLSSGAGSAHDPIERLAVLDAQLAVRPDDVDALLARGAIWLELDRPQRAAEDFERAVALAPTSVPAQLGLARACAAVGQHADALRGAEAALRLEPTSVAAAEACARALASSGRFADALGAWDRVLAACAAPTADHWLARADAAVAAGDVRSALAGLDDAVARVGPLVVLEERAAALCEAAGDFTGAAARLESILATVARPERWLAWQARLAERGGQVAVAAAARGRALAAIDVLPAARREDRATRSLRAALLRDLDAGPRVAPSLRTVHAARVASVDVQPPSVPATSGPGKVLVEMDDEWRYLDDGSDQGTAWQAPGFDDSRWARGRAELGYGDGDERTVIGFGPNPLDKYVTSYFRRTFRILDPRIVDSARIDLLRDDGAIVYLNGVEIARTNLPELGVNHRTLALTAVDGSEERRVHPFAFPPSLLVPGDNVLAVEVHQVSGTSSDVSFALELSVAEPILVTRQPYLQLGTETSATIRWRTDNETTSGVWLNSSPALLRLAAYDRTLRRDHSVTLTGLRPNTRYFYAVGDGLRQLAGGTGEHYFETAPPRGTSRPTRIWVIGDSGTANASAAAVRDAYLAFAAGQATDVWLMLGDNAYAIGTDREYQAAVFDMYPTLLANTFVWPTLGNHDAASARSATQSGVYYDIFDLPRQAEAGGVASGTEAYYSFDRGRIHIVCLDSHDSDRSVGGPMLSWLRADLANTTADWVIAFWHHPPYTKGSHDSDNPFDSEGRLKDMRENVLPILESFGVDMVLAGHSHSYERSCLLDGHYGLSTTLTPQMKLDAGDGRIAGDGAYAKRSRGVAPHEGAVYVVAGSSGWLGGGTLDHPAMVTSLNKLGSLVLDIVGDRLDARFLDDAGRVQDAFTLEKGLRRWLSRVEPTISLASGGGQALALDAGSAHAGRFYVLAGSSGTTPGLVFGGVHIPLNPGSYFAFSLGNPNSAVFQNSMGVLDPQGRAQARVQLPPLSASLAGVELFHAFFLHDGANVLAASNAVKVRLVQ